MSAATRRRGYHDAADAATEVPPITGRAGGATDTGVTDDTVRVVVYTTQENDPVLSFIYGQIGNDDTPTDISETYEGFNELLGSYMETYGRTVELVRYNATGPISDAIAATTDAETIAHDLEPFAVLGGPNLTEAFAETLAANEVLCIPCRPGRPPSGTRSGVPTSGTSRRTRTSRRSWRRSTSASDSQTATPCSAVTRSATSRDASG